MAFAFAMPSASFDVMKMLPSSWMSISTPVSSVMPRTTLPPVPMTSRIFSVGIVMVSTRGAYGESSFAGSAMHSSILLRMNARPRFACASADARMSRDRPSTLMSIWTAVMPSDVPATLKSMSPSASSMPWMSVRIV